MSSGRIKFWNGTKGQLELENGISREIDKNNIKCGIEEIKAGVKVEFFLNNGKFEVVSVFKEGYMPRQQNNTSLKQNPNLYNNKNRNNSQNVKNYDQPRGGACPEENSKFLNPYNFSRFIKPGNIMSKRSGKNFLYGKEESTRENLLSGTLKCSLKAVTNLFISSGKQLTEGNEKCETVAARAV